MYNGFLALGGPTLEEERFELVNSGRVAAYIANFNAINQQRVNEAIGGIGAGCATINWFNGCDECFQADDVFTNGQGYQTPEADPAPWFDPLQPDSQRFLGIVGLDVQGAEDSTRSATVVQAMSGGGSVGRLRFGPRTMVVRALAVALDDCGMEIGLNWLRCQYETTIDACGGDYLWFLDCCPDCVPDPNAPIVGPCWADNYGQLSPPGPPDCPAGTWWPTTYAELRDGPPATETEWCAWVVIYRDLTTGLPQYSCDSFECIEPHLRQFTKVRIIEGPTILSRRTMSSVGEIAEIEFTIVAADPHEYTPETLVMTGAVTPTAVYVDPPAAPPVVDPFEPTPPIVIPRGPVTTIPFPAQWARTTIPFDLPPTNNMGSIVPRLTLQASQQVGPLRVGLWVGDELLGGYTVPYIPANASIDVDGVHRAVTSSLLGGPKVNRSGFLTGYAGRGPIDWDELPRDAEYRLTIDQPESNPTGALNISLYAATRACA